MRLKNVWHAQAMTTFVFVFQTSRHIKSRDYIFNANLIRHYGILLFMGKYRIDVMSI